MSTLEDLKTEYKKQLHLSKMELGNLDRNTKFTAEGMVNAAKQKLQTLRPQLMSLILGNSTIIYVDKGMDLSAQISEIMGSAQNVALLDYLELDKIIFDRTYPTTKIKGYPFNTEAVSRINNALYDLRNVISAEYIPAVKASANQYQVHENGESAMTQLRKILDDTFGNGLKTLFLAKKMNDFTDVRMSEFDSMVFFVTGLVGNTQGLDGVAGKTVYLTTDDSLPADAAELQKLVGKKLRDRKKVLTSSNE